MTVRDDLIAARKLIEKPEDWQRRSYHNDECTSFCVYGALDHAAGGDFKADMDTIAALRRELPAPWNELVSFNDDPATTHNDILALFDRAINAAEAP